MFSCAVWFWKSILKIPDLSLPPCILGTPSSYMYDFAPDPILISLYMRKILFSFLSVCTQEPHVHFGDPTPYLAYGWDPPDLYLKNGSDGQNLCSTSAQAQLIAQYLFNKLYLCCRLMKKDDIPRIFGTITVAIPSCILETECCL